MEGQNYRRTEIIVIDDGSTDESAQIIQKYALDDPRIIYIHTENRGVSSARNTGLLRATGIYVTFLDADDLMSENYLQMMISQIGNADVCVCKKVRWNQRTRRSRVDGWPEFRGSKEELRRNLFAYQRSMRGATGRLYKMSLIKEHDIRFREDLNYSEDMHFNYAFFRYISNAVFLDAPLYTYRIHNKQSLTSLDHTFFLKQWHTQKKCMVEAFGK